MSNTYVMGNVIRLFGSFFASDGVTPADPTTVTVVYRTPASGAEQTATPTRDGVGVYHSDITANLPGDYWYRFVGAGAVVAQTDDERFTITARSF